MAASSNRAAPSWSTSSRPKATIRSCGGWASRRQRRPRPMAVKAQDLSKDYKYGFSDPEQCAFKSRRGLDHDIVRQISQYKKEPDWMLQFRLRALDIFLKKPMPAWPTANLSEIDFQNIFYYVRPSENTAEKNWEDVPTYIKDTFDKLGIPAADNKFAALNSAVWSGGSFIYVPKNTEVEIPLQAYFRINAENMGQFERTLIIADEGSKVHYVEGCSAPIYTSDSLHSAVVELVAKPGAHIRYTTIQNWSNNVYNLVTKRAVAYADATVEWVDGNLGSKVTMKYPSVSLLGPRARAELLSVAFAGAGQLQDAGGKVIHAAPDTTSTITSKSISKDGGNAIYRGLLKVHEGCHDAKSR